MSKNNTLKEIMSGTKYNYECLNIAVDDRARTKIVQGISYIAGIVGLTLGRHGYNAILQHGDEMPIVTKDGVSVANKTIVPDPIVAIGTRLARQASNETDATCGDGTTTTMVLLDLLTRLGMADVDSGINVHMVRSQLQDEVNALRDEIKARTITITDELLDKVAMTSSNGNAELSKISIELAKKVAGVGKVNIKRGYAGSQDEIVEYPGCRFDIGLPTQRLVNDGARGVFFAENPQIIFVEDARQFLKTYGQHLDGFRGKTLIISDFGNTDQTFDLLPKHGISFIRTPGFGDDQVNGYRDLEVLLTDTEIEMTGLEDDVFKIYTCKSLTIANDHTTFVADEERASAIEAHVDELRGLRDKNNAFVYNLIEGRIASLTGKWVTLMVGGRTHSEIKERYDHYVDTIRSCENAILSGVVRGGCRTLVESAHATKIERMIDLAQYMQDLVTKGLPMGDDDPYDPAIVPLTALDNAMAVAGQVITTQSVVTNFHHAVE